MKFIIYISTLLFTVTSCISEHSNLLEVGRVNCDNLNLDPLYNHFYLENRKEPFTGLCYKLDKKSDTIETINYNKGKVEGVLTTFYPSGMKKTETSFKKNKHHGDYKEWNNDGILIFYGMYNDGEYDTTLIDNRR